MTEQFTFSEDKARAIGETIGIDWATSRFDVAQFQKGLDVELEHGIRDPATNVSDDDEITTGKIALAHLNEFPDYYTRLAEMEAERYWAAHDENPAGDRQRSEWPFGSISSDRVSSDDEHRQQDCCRGDGSGAAG